MPYLDRGQGPFWNLDGASLGHMAARPAGTDQSAGGERTILSARGRPQGSDLGFGLAFSITRASRRDLGFMGLRWTKGGRDRPWSTPSRCSDPRRWSSHRSRILTGEGCHAS
jgi:hypothetical protein